MSKSHETIKRYEDAILRASHGDEDAEKLLRMRLRKTADTMPVPILVIVSQSLLECRREQLRQEAALSTSRPVQEDQEYPASWSTIY